MTHDDSDITSALKHYDSPLPSDMRDPLLTQLDRHMPPKQPRKAPWLWAGVTGIAATMAVTWIVYAMNRPQPAPPPVAGKPEQKSPEAVSDGGAAPFRSRGMAMASSVAGTSRDQDALFASSIVRVKILGWTGQKIDFEVQRLIYGQPVDKVLHLNILEGDLTSFLEVSRPRFMETHVGRAPTEDELYAQFMQDHNILKGREMILVLQPVVRFEKDGPTFNGNVMISSRYHQDATGEFLDKLEGEFAQVFRDGSFLEPVSLGKPNVQAVMAEDRALFLKWMYADAVVRASVVEVTGTGTRSRIEKIFKGKVDTGEIFISHDIFQKRAEAVASYEALKDPALLVKRTQRITQLVKSFIDAELLSKPADGVLAAADPNLPRHAILFLGNLKAEAGRTLAQLQARIYDNSTRVAIKDIEDAFARDALAKWMDGDPAILAGVQDGGRRGAAPGEAGGPAIGVRVPLGSTAQREIDRVAQADLIVRAHVDNVTDATVTYTIKRVLYGKTDEKSLTLANLDPSRPDLTPLGSDVILYLVAVPDQANYRVISTRYDNAVHPLNETEPIVLAMIKETRPPAVTAPVAGLVAPAAAFPSIELRISRATAIVRARITGWKDGFVDYEVLRPVYGNIEDKTVSLEASFLRARATMEQNASKRFQEENGREPNAEELDVAVMKSHGIVKGREALLMLQPNFSKWIGGKYLASIAFDDEARGLVDSEEMVTVRVLKEGNYLEAAPVGGFGDFFEQSLRQSESVVRATVVKTDETATTWRVAKTIRGKETGPSLVIDHTLFRMRAEAVVRYAALTDDSLKDPAKREARIKEEMNALIQAELKPGREAILFIAKLKSENGTTRAEMQFRSFSDSKRMTLEKLEEMLANPEKVGTGL